MNDFNKLCKEFENIDSDTYVAFLTEEAATILPQLSALSVDGESGPEIFALFVMASFVADGKLSEEEYAALYPLLHAFLGDSVNYDDCKKAISGLKEESKDMKRIADEMVDMIGQVSPTLKDQIIIVCMLLCAIDGKISYKEKQWIQKLIEE